jgi:hypothetical protein
MKKLVSISFGIVLGLTTASAVSLAQSVSPAGSHQHGHQPQAGVRIFINDRLLTENAMLARGTGTAEHIRKLGGSTGVAESPISNPDPNRKEADPTPFPLTGEIYISVVDLAAALNGHKTLEPHLKIEGDKLYAHGKPKYEDWLAVNNDGLISSALRELKGADGEQQLYVPLNDLVKALGGKLKADEARRAYVITVSSDTNSLLSLVQK